MRSDEINKSNFAQTCNRLSQFLKERRSLGDFGFHNLASSKLEITEATKLSLLAKNMMEKEGNVSSVQSPKSLDLFPLTSSSDAVRTQVSTQNMSNCECRELPKSNEEAKTNTSTMTIFYGGRVQVFDELPEEKAQEIMSLASQCALLQDPVTQPDTMPMKRRASLHRFIEKRKDRIAAITPYQLHDSSVDMAHSNPKKYNLIRNLHQLELKL